MLYNKRLYYNCFITEGVIIYALDLSVFRPESCPDVVDRKKTN